MRISVSNIAWDPAEDDEIGALLRKLGIGAVDVAPPKYFPNPQRATSQDVLEVRQQWRDRGFDIVGMQALMFGTTGLNLFADAKVQQAMLDHLQHVARIGAMLGAPRLVFGSPRNRDRSELTEAQAQDVAIRFFSRLGEIAIQEGVIFCLEPNPAAYNCNFLTTTSQALDFVASLDHPGIRMQLDLGALTMNAEDVSVILPAARDWIGHIHISEPQLVPIGDVGTDHRALREAVQRVGMDDFIATIEMVATKEESHLQSIERSCLQVMQHYSDTRWPHKGWQ